MARVLLMCVAGALLLSAAAAACVESGPGSSLGGCAHEGDTCVDDTGSAKACLDENDPNIQCDDDTKECWVPPKFADVYMKPCNASAAFACDYDGSGFLSCTQVSNETETYCQLVSQLDGDFCSIDAECASRTCLDGVCVGVDEGGACTYTGECAGATYCDFSAPPNGTFGGTCQQQLGVGDRCEPMANQCMPGTLCLSSGVGAGECVRMFSLSDGEVVGSMLGEVLCGSGYGRIVNDTTQVCDEFPYEQVGTACDSGENCICPNGGDASGTGIVMPLAAPAATDVYSPSVGDCLYYACNTEITELKCSQQLNPFQAVSFATVIERLRMPSCISEFAAQVYASTGACEDYMGDCQEFQGKGKCA